MSQHRQFERYDCTDVTCDLGEVVNLSGGGICIASKRRLPITIGEQYPVTLIMQGERRRLIAQAKWSRKTGVLQQQTGFNFPELTGDQQNRFQQNLLLQIHEHGGGVQAEFELPNYFQVLGLMPEADTASIQRAYDQLLEETELPVRATSIDREAHNKTLKGFRQAYKVLMQPEQREAVRVFLEHKAFQASRPHPAPFWDTPAEQTSQAEPHTADNDQAA